MGLSNVQPLTAKLSRPTLFQDRPVLPDTDVPIDTI